MFGYSLKHISIVGGFLVALGAFVASQPNWAAFTSPMSVGALLGVVGAFLAGLYSEKPGSEQ